MRVVLNTVPLYGKGAGARTYTAQLLRALSASDADMEWLVALRPSESERLGLNRDARFRRLPIASPAAPPSAPGARFLWRNALEQAIIPLQARRYDVLHYLDSYGPVARPRGVPLALTVHDILPLTHPEYFRPRSRRYLAPLMSRTIPRADAIMAISGATAQTLIDRLHVSPERIRVVHNGVEPLFRPAPAAEVARARRRYGIEWPYLIAVGAIERRKNLPRVIRAFAQARREAGLPHHLLLVGSAGLGDEEVVEAITSAGVAGLTHLLGYTPRADLPALLTGADVALYLSLAEGFGLPIIEAMACGTPVIASTAPALVEVAGDAALLVDPTDEEGITRALTDLCRDPAGRSRLSQAGVEQARRYTWARVADEAIRLYGALGTLQ